MTSVGNVRVVALDAPRQIEAVLSEGLPPDPAQAAAIARERVAQNPDAHKQLRAAYEGVLLAYRLGIQKVPAVVVNRRYVVYGEHDVHAAVEMIAEYRGTR